MIESYGSFSILDQLHGLWWRRDSFNFNLRLLKKESEKSLRGICIIFFRKIKQEHTLVCPTVEAGTESYTTIFDLFTKTDTSCDRSQVLRAQANIQ